MEALLDSGAMGLVMSSEFARKQDFKLEKAGETNEYKECGWIVEQGGAHRAYDGS